MLDSDLVSNLTSMTSSVVNHHFCTRFHIFQKTFCSLAGLSEWQEEGEPRQTSPPYQSTLIGL